MSKIKRGKREAVGSTASSALLALAVAAALHESALLLLVLKLLLS